MRVVCLLLLGLATAAAAMPVAAQRPVRVGPAFSVIALDEGSGTEQYPSYGGSIAFRTGDEAEAGLVVARYADLSGNACERSMTFVGLDSYYYPVGATGIAPFAATSLGLALVTDADPGLLGICTPTSEPTNELGYGFGLGLRFNVGTTVVGMFEGRFFQVPNSAIQALEARAAVSVAFGTPRAARFASGTVGPTLGWAAALSGELQGRGPLLGVRFRRDTRTGGVVSLEVHYAPLEIREGCSSECEPAAVLFAPAYEASLRPAWGRLYGGVGALLAGFPQVGADRGVLPGAHGGVGADVFAGERVMVGFGARVLWLQRRGGDNAFLLLLGASVSPRPEPPPTTLE